VWFKFGLHVGELETKYVILLNTYCFRPIETLGLRCSLREELLRKNSYIILYYMLLLDNKNSAPHSVDQNFFVVT